MLPLKTANFELGYSYTRTLDEKLNKREEENCCYENNLKEQSCEKKAAVFANAKIHFKSLKKHLGKQITAFQLFFHIFFGFGLWGARTRLEEIFRIFNVA